MKNKELGLQLNFCCFSTFHTFSEMANGNPVARVFWKDDELRSPLSLKTYATRVMIRNGMTNFAADAIPRHLLRDFDKLRSIHGKQKFVLIVCFKSVNNCIF